MLSLLLFFGLQQFLFPSHLLKFLVISILDQLHFILKHVLGRLFCLFLFKFAHLDHH